MTKQPGYENGSDAVERDVHQPHHAILLAAGRGKRLAPYTNTVPKPLLPVRIESDDGTAVYRSTLDLMFEQLAAAGIRSITLVTHHLEQQIARYAQQQTWLEQVSICHQTSMNGTAPAVLSALQASPASQPRNADNRPILVTATDYLVPQAFYREFTDFHAGHGKDISVSLKKVPEHELSSRSSVALDSSMHIQRIVEKPAPGEAPSHYSANLLFVLPARIVSHLARVEPSPRGELEIQDAVNALISEGAVAVGLLQHTPQEWQPCCLHETPANGRISA